MIKTSQGYVTAKHESNFEIQLLFHCLSILGLFFKHTSLWELKKKNEMQRGSHKGEQ